MNATAFVNLHQAFADLRCGKMIVLFDHKQRENEGDLVLAAEDVTAEKINFMAQYGRGLICLALVEHDVQRLGLAAMVTESNNPVGTAFTVSIEAARGISTGISAQDRAHTIKTAADPTSLAKDFVTPGHVFPLKARQHGVLTRPGHTEGSTDLMRLAGCKQSAAVICEIMNPDGTMANFSDLQRFSQQHRLTLLSIQELIHYRLSTECLVEEVVTTNLPTEHQGGFQLRLFKNKIDDQSHLALINDRDHKQHEPILVRVHSECLTGDLFHSKRCDCGWQLQQSLTQIQQHGGILLYLRQEGRGIGLVNKLKAYALQDQGLDTVEANQKLGFNKDERQYWIAAQILRKLNVQTIHLLTNNPQKIADLERFGIRVLQRIPLQVPVTADNHFYLKTKQIKLGHLLDIPDKLT